MQVAVWLIGMLALVVLTWRARRWLRARSHREFEDLVFRTPAGPLPGREMTVIKRVVHPGTSALGSARGSAFYYCKGPGPSYFMAMREAPDAHRGEGTPGAWVVTPLTPERLRGALAGDEDALGRAFGDVIEDRLRA